MLRARSTGWTRPRLATCKCIGISRCFQRPKRPCDPLAHTAVLPQRNYRHVRILVLKRMEKFHREPTNLFLSAADNILLLVLRPLMYSAYLSAGCIIRTSCDDPVRCSCANFEKTPARDSVFNASLTNTLSPLLACPPGEARRTPSICLPLLW